MLQELDSLLSRYHQGLSEAPSALDLNLKACERSKALLHQAGALEELPAISEVLSVHGHVT